MNRRVAKESEAGHGAGLALFGPRIFTVFALVLLFMVPVSRGSDARHELEAILDKVSPSVRKWATVVLVCGEKDKPRFEWFDYRETGNSIEFWPASVVKLYVVIAAMEYLNELGAPLDCTLGFEHGRDGNWNFDTRRPMKRMISEVFRRSSNDDYTLLLRFVGLDRLNTKFLIAERGFPRTAVMRGYSELPPFRYLPEEAQRITIQAAGKKEIVVEHAFSGRLYAKELGAKIFDPARDNCTTTREMADCMRRIMFHENLPEAERFRLTADQLRFLREAEKGYTGLRSVARYPPAWTGGIETVFPKARFFHKAGRISTYVLDLAYVEDPKSKTRFIVALASQTQPSKTVSRMARQIAIWAKAKNGNKTPPR